MKTKSKSKANAGNKRPTPVQFIRENTRKRRVHHERTLRGEDKAMALGLKLKLKKTTLRSWFSTWRQMPKAWHTSAVKKNTAAVLKIA